MKQRIMFFVSLMIVAILFIPKNANAQIHDYNSKFGLQFSGALPATEFWESNGLKGSYVSRAFIRFGLSDIFQLEFGGGYGSLAGFDFNKMYYRTEIIPIDARLLVNLMENEDWNPYIYGGIGMLDYKVTHLPSVVSPKSVKKDGVTGVIPVGIGFEFALADNFLLDISGGANYSFTDDLNYYRLGSPKDAYYSAGIGFVFVTGSSNTDSDHDGLTNKEEKELGTDQNNPDTDGDGLSDGDDVHTYHTNPLKADTDGDGLKDGEEVMKYHTDPLKVDTDGDGLNDGDEVIKYHADPLKADTDGDGLNDGDEVLKYHTDPLKADTDGDGLNDGEEVMKYHIDPLKADTDDDGLNDGDEVMKYKTDPLKADTDAGTVNDGQEITNGTNALDPTDDIPKKQQELKAEVGVPIVLEGIVFKTGSAQISPESEEILIQAFNTLDRHPEIEVEIQGHTDNVGKHDMNMKLSKRRADAVKAWLVKKGIIASRITTKGFGPNKPTAPNTTAEGKLKNRRIEFLRTK
jgi:outer membrane protein OmpA-like peptidoglycan-associated protein